MNKSALLQMLKMILPASALLLSNLALAAEPDVPMSRSGSITQVNPEANEIVINGRTFELPDDTAVFVKGHRVDVTDLNADMLVGFAVQSGTGSKKVPTIQAIKIVSKGEDILKH